MYEEYRAIYSINMTDWPEEVLDYFDNMKNNDENKIYCGNVYGGLTCTREKFHNGPHVAHGEEETCGVWD